MTHLAINRLHARGAAGGGAIFQEKDTRVSVKSDERMVLALLALVELCVFSISWVIGWSPDAPRVDGVDSLGTATAFLSWG